MKNNRRYWVVIGSCLAVLHAHASATPTQEVDPISLAVGSAFDVPEDPQFVAVGDLNNDRFDDAVVVSPSGAVTAVLSAGLGSFATATGSKEEYRLGPHVVVDLDGDSILDVAVISEGLDGVAVAAGIGDGTFGVRRLTPVAGQPKIIATANLDDDPAADLVVAGAGGDVVLVGNRLTTLGEFTQQLIAELNAAPHAIATTDLDLDGRLDVVVLATSTDGLAKLVVLRNEGAGLFARFENLTDPLPAAMAVADYNRDGFADVAILHPGEFLGGHITLWLNHSLAGAKLPKDGFFHPGEDLPISCPGSWNGVPTVCRISDVVAGDLNDDHKADLAAVVDLVTEADITMRVPGQVQAFIGLGNGQFVFSTRVNVGLGPQGLAVGQLSGEGADDLASTELDSNGDPQRSVGGLRILRTVKQVDRPDGCHDDLQCATGHCVDGTCCTVPECPEGERCDMPFFSGECHRLGSCGEECWIGEQCESGYCVEGSCCDTPACPSGYYCGSGECTVPGVGIGACQDDLQCATGHCVDGICCSQAACEAPERCDVRRFEGECTDPDSFGPRSFGNPCAGEADCDARFSCTDGVCCAHRDCGPWHRCNVPGAEGVCAILPSLGVGCLRTRTPEMRTPTQTATPSPAATSTPVPPLEADPIREVAEDGCAVSGSPRSHAVGFLMLVAALLLWGVRRSS